MDLLVLRAKQWEKAVQGFDQAIAHDPRSPGSVTEFAITLFFLRQFRASEQAYDRLIELVPDQPMLKVQRAYHVTAKSGDATPLRLALDALPASTADDKGALCWRLRFALSSRDWMQAKQLIEKLAGGDSAPASCNLLLYDCRCSGKARQMLGRFDTGGWESALHMAGGRSMASGQDGS